jgi:hypothetical protein
VWHASATVVNGDRRGGLERARAALHGVGDRSLGEWIEQGERAVHVRRRLSSREQMATGEARDIRGTPEERERLRVLAAELPPQLRALVEARMGRLDRWTTKGDEG